MKKILQILAVLLPLILNAQTPDSIPSLSMKKVSFTISDSDGRPLEGVRLVASKPGPGNTEGTTDSDGKVSLRLAEGANLFLTASKEGYYDTGGEIWRGGMVKGPGRGLVAREVPDHFDIELKEIRNPVFLHRHRFRGLAPASSKPVGYDLKVGDWVGPHGKGVTNDMYFHFHDMFVRDNEFAGTMTLSFPNEGDGIQAFDAARPFSMEYGSDLAPPHEAPENGYLPTLSYSLAHREGEPYQSYKKPRRNYLLRTRTVTDAEGRILQACYTWIRGEIEFDPRGEGAVQLAFESYFNPDPDPRERSLEYNLKTAGRNPRISFRGSASGSP